MSSVLPRMWQKGSGNEVLKADLQRCAAAQHTDKSVAGRPKFRILFEGPLVKRGKLFKSWKPRWFAAVAPGVLYYFDSHAKLQQFKKLVCLGPEATAQNVLSMNLVLGSIRLNKNAGVDYIGSFDKQSKVFVIESGSRDIKTGGALRVMYLRPPTAEEEKKMIASVTGNKATTEQESNADQERRQQQAGLGSGMKGAGRVPGRSLPSARQVPASVERKAKQRGNSSVSALAQKRHSGLCAVNLSNQGASQYAESDFKFWEKAIRFFDSYSIWLKQLGDLDVRKATHAKLVSAYRRQYDAPMILTSKQEDQWNFSVGSRGAGSGSSANAGPDLFRGSLKCVKGRLLAKTLSICQDAAQTQLLISGEQFHGYTSEADGGEIKFFELHTDKPLVTVHFEEGLWFIEGDSQLPSPTLSGVKKNTKKEALSEDRPDIIVMLVGIARWMFARVEEVQCMTQFDNLYQLHVGPTEKKVREDAQAIIEDWRNELKKTSLEECPTCKGKSDTLKICLDCKLGFCENEPCTPELKHDDDDLVFCPRCSSTSVDSSEYLWSLVPPPDHPVSIKKDQVEQELKAKVELKVKKFNATFKRPFSSGLRDLVVKAKKYGL